VSNSAGVTTTGTFISDYSITSETKSNSQSSYTGKKNWVTDSTGSTWTSSTSGSSSGSSEKTDQKSSQLSWDLTMTEVDSGHHYQSIDTVTSTGSSSSDDSDHQKSIWTGSYTNSSKSDGSSTRTELSSGTSVHDWKSSESLSDQWTETFWENDDGDIYTSSSGGSGSTGSSSSGSTTVNWSETETETIPPTIPPSGGGASGGGGNNSGGSGSNSGGSTSETTSTPSEHDFTLEQKQAIWADQAEWASSPLKKPVFSRNGGQSSHREFGDGIFQILAGGAYQEAPEVQDRSRGNLGSADQPTEGGETPRFAAADELPQDQAEVVGGGGE